MHCELKTKRLLLRPLNISDLDSVHEYTSDSENTVYRLNLPYNTKEETACFLNMVTAEWSKEMPEFYDFAVILHAKQIGAVSVALNNDRTIGELACIIHKRYWGNGYAKEAVQTLIDFAFQELKLLKLTAYCDYRNIVSQKLLEKAGLQLENTNRTRTYLKTSETSIELEYSLTVNPKPFL